MQKKIVSLEELAPRLEELRRNGQKIVLCSGIFDVLHIGHMRYLKQASSYGDVLVVSVSSDHSLQKGVKLQFDETLRAEAVASLGWVSAVVINPFGDVHEIVQRLRPEYFVRGFESADLTNGKNGGEGQERDLLEEWGVKVAVVQENGFSSTSQINRYISGMPEDIQKYLQLFKKRYDLRRVLQSLEQMNKIRVLVIGDTILDEYYYCSAIGKSSKDPTLALKYLSHDLFAGGVLAVANHVAGFAKQVDLVTVIGERDSHEPFIRSKLKEGVRVEFLVKENAPTLIKRRFLDSYSMTKLLEVYVMDDKPLRGNQDDALCEMIEAKLASYDLVMAADFGHGTINTRLKELLSGKAPYLALNAQSNAGNRGFNNITKYRHADFVSMAEHEVRLEMRDLNGKIWPMVNTLVKGMGCRKFVVTRGRKGCLVHDRNEGGFVQVPSFARTVVDRVGAGDALFAITSLGAVLDLPCELIGFLGNVAGSLAVEVMGNQKSMDEENVIRYIQQLLS